MGAPPLEVGEHEEIRFWTSNGRGYASARVRDVDGVRRLVKRSGRSVGEAKRRLASALTYCPDFIPKPAGATVTEVAGEWFEFRVQLNRWSDRTRIAYRSTLDALVLPSFGDVECRTVTTPMMNRCLSDDRGDTAPAAAAVGKLVDIVPEAADLLREIQARIANES